MPGIQRILVRMDRSAGRDAAVLAHATIVFLDDQGANGLFDCWAYVGQYGSCTRDWVMSATRNADTSEAAAAIAQWRSEGPDRSTQDVRFKVYERMPRS